MLESVRMERILPPAVSEAEDITATRPGTLHFQIALIREAALTLLNRLEPLADSEEASEGETVVSLYDEVRRLEVKLISNALSQTYGHQKKAARLLGIKATTLNSKIKRYKILPFAQGWAFSRDTETVNESEVQTG